MGPHVFPFIPPHWYFQDLGYSHLEKQADSDGTQTLFMFSFGSVGIPFFFHTSMHILCCVYTCSHVCASGGHRLIMGVFLDHAPIEQGLSLLWIWLVYLASLPQGANLCLTSAGITGNLEFFIWELYSRETSVRFIYFIIYVLIFVKKGPTYRPSRADFKSFQEN